MSHLRWGRDSSGSTRLISAALRNQGRWGLMAITFLAISCKGALKSLICCSVKNLGSFKFINFLFRGEKSWSPVNVIFSVRVPSARPRC